MHLKYRYHAHCTGSSLGSATTLLLGSTGNVSLCQWWEAKTISVLLMTKYLSLLAIICSLHLKISYFKADYPQRIDSFPVFLMQFLTHDVLRTCLQHA